MTQTLPELVLCQVEDQRWHRLKLESLASRAASATLSRLGLPEEEFEISLLGTNDSHVAALNGQFRGKPDPTNVLSWPSQDCSADVPGNRPRRPDDPELGDIALAWETCAREADAADRPLDTHVTHLLVHGVLHLLGYDHERDADATLMERLEIEILATLGVPDPYS